MDRKARGEKKDGAADCSGGAEPRLGHVAPIRERERDERKEKWRRGGTSDQALRG